MKFRNWLVSLAHVSLAPASLALVFLGPASLALLGCVAASGQQVSTVKRTVTTIAKGKTVSVKTRLVRVITTPAPALSKPVAVSSAVRLPMSNGQAGSVGAKVPATTLPATTLPNTTLPAVKKVHPALFPGYPNATISSQSFPATAVGQTSAPVTITFPFPPGGNYQELSFAGNSNAFEGQATCSMTACSAPISFVPNYPGLMKDAIISKDENGNVLYETLIYGIGTAPQFGFDEGATTIHGSVTNQPGSIAVGPDGSIYLTDASENTVTKIAPDFSSHTQLSIAELGVPGGIAVDGAGTVYVSDKTNNKIVAYNTGGGQTALTTSQLANPNGLGVDGTGAVYIADTGNNRIIKIDNQGTETTLASGLDSPTSLAVDGAGDVFYVDAANGGEVVELPVGNNPVSIATQQGTLYDMAVDAAGRLYLATPGGDLLISPDGTIQEYGGGPNYGMALDQAGDVLFSQPAKGAILSNNRSVSNFTLSTQVGSTTTGGDTISNTGNAALTLSNIAISGGNVFTDDPSDACVAGLTLQPAKRCDTLVDFAPAAAQSYTESYTVTSNSLNTPGTTDVDTLNGNGIGASTSTALSISPSPASPGQGATFTATVNQQNGSDQPAPTGTVNFLDGTTALGSGTISGNTATYATANLAGGTHSITAMYAGDNYNATSTSAAQSLLVTAGNTSMTLLVSTPAMPVAGQTVTFLVGVSGASQTTVATGTVTLTNAGVTLATVTLDNTGQGSFNAAYLAPGSYSVTGNYSGDATYSPSTSGVDSFTVAPAAAPSFVSNIGTPLAAQSVGVILAAAGTVQSVQVLTQGATGLDFTMASGGTCATGTAYTAGQYCTVNVVFNPQHAGTRTGAVLLLDANNQTLGVTYLPGSGVGPQIIYGAGTQSALGGGVSSPQGLGLDGAGNVYVADQAGGFVKEIPLGCTSAACVKTLASGFMYPNGLAVDGAGNVFFDDFSNSNNSGSSSSDNLVEEIPFGCTSASCFRTLGSGFNLLVGIAVDLSGDVFVSDFGNNAVKELVAVNGVVPTSPTINVLAGGFTGQTGPDGLTLDPSGNVYVTDHDNGHALYEIPFAGGYSTLNTISASFTAPEDVKFDGTGNAYVVDEDTNSLYELPASGGTLPASPTMNTLAANFNSPESVAVDGLGNVYVSDYGNQRVVKIDYSDPTALNFATTTTVGSTDTADGPQMVTVRNNGNAALTFTGLVPSTNFTIDTGTTTCSTTGPLAAGSSCVVGVDFAPTVAGPLSGTLTLTDNAQNVAGASQSIPLTGTGVAGSAPPIASVTTLTSTPAAPTVGQNVTFSVAVTGATPVATGIVTLMNTAVSPATVLGTITLGSAGTGTFSTATLAAGTYSVTATYSGDANYAASTSSVDTFTISPAPVTMTLAVSPTTGAQGTVFTLTATVVEGNGDAVTNGQVQLLDNGKLLATVQLVSTTGATEGTATYATRSFAIGPHSLTAKFLGTKLFGQSTTPMPVTLSVTGKYASGTVLTDTGMQGNYALTATVDGSGLGSPSGNVVFTDLSTSTTLGTVALTSVVQSYVPATPIALNSGPNQAVPADVNGDGKPDLVLGNQSGTMVTVLIGNGDGTYTALPSFGTNYDGISGLAVGDFNGDGKLDIATANGTTVGIFLGNGDGTFGAEQDIQNPNSSKGVYAADFNKDGNLDLAVTDNNSGITIMTGNGDGTFTLSSTVLSTGSGANFQIAVADFNLDGNLDIAVGNYYDDTVSVLLGNGDGTFQGQRTYSTGSGPRAGFSGDFNGDGYPDLMLTDGNGASVCVLLGNGDGTFQETQTYSVGSNPSRASIGDLNGDGKLDIAVANQDDGTISVLLGNGDGSFQTQQVLTAGSGPDDVAISDANGDGSPYLQAANVSGSTVSVFLSAETAAASLYGVTLSGTGSDNVSATYSGDTSFGGSTSNTLSLPSNSLAGTTTLLVSAPAAPTVGQSVVFTVSVGGTGQSTPAPTGTVTLMNTAVTPATVLGTITLSGGSGTFSTATLAAGIYAVTATYSGDSVYAASTSGADTFTVASAVVAVATTTALTASPDTVAYEKPITLSALVSTASGSAVTAGQVVFCDVTNTFSTPHCTLSSSTNVGVAQLNANGSAVLRLSPGTIGNHIFEAVFAGTNAASTSTSAQTTVAVTGTYPTTTAIAATGTPGNYTLTASVAGTGNVLVGPAGTVTFQTASGGTALGTAALGTSALGLGFTNLTIATTVNYPGGRSAVGDFNGDGILDVAFANDAPYPTDTTNANTVTIALGNGDGTFTTVAAHPATGTNPNAIVSGDFNGDGNLDLATVNYTSSTVTILLGNGDGTFTAGASPAAGTNPYGIVAGDFNGDGIEDLVVSTINNALIVMLGNGDGTFTASTLTLNGYLCSMAVGDFNGDGKTDIAITNAHPTSELEILLGNGDGTFTVGTPIAEGSGSNLNQVAAGDLNGDGKIDLVVTNQQDDTVTALLSNGDGTFRQIPVASAQGTDPEDVQIADFNGDGLADIAVSYSYGGHGGLQVLPGNGDGTFTASPVLSGNTVFGGIALGDFNGDGILDIASSDGASDLEIALTQITQTATATVSNISPAGSGTVNVDAMYPGNTTYSASVSQPAVLTESGPVASATTVAITPAAPTFGQSVAFSVLVSGAPQLLPVPTGTVALMNTAVTPNALLGTITLGATGAGTFSTATLAVGTYSVVASYSGDTNYLASTSAPGALVVSKDAQTITFGALGNQTYGVAPLALTATAVSGLPVSFSVTGPATVNGAVLTITGAGQVLVTAAQAGNATYAAATAVSQSFTVAQAVLTVTANNASRKFGAANPAFTYATTGLVDGDTAAVVGGTATLSTTAAATSDAGTYPITFATKALTATNYSFNYVGGTLTVLGGAAQTITFPAVPTHAAGDAPFMLTATASSGLAVSYAVTAGPATVAGSTVTLTGAGTVTIQATQAGNLDYAAATPVSQTFTVSAVPAPAAASIAPTGVVAGSAATTVTLTGANFTSTDVVELNATMLTTTFVNATTLTALVPATLVGQPGTLTVSVVDTATGETSGALSFAVAMAPVVVFTGPTTATSDQQPMVTFQLKQPYAVPINCLLTLTFAPATSTGIDDPAVQFSSGGRTISFTVQAGSIATPPVQFQTGTVAGTVTVTLGIVADLVNVTPANVAPVVVVLPAVVPQVTTATVARTGAGTSGQLTVTMTGFSNTREVKSAVFHFTPTPGNTLSNPDVTVDVTDIFTTWYVGDSESSDAYGSSFTYTQPFSLSADPATIQSVTVTLVNGVGNSLPQTSE